MRVIMHTEQSYLNRDCTCSILNRKEVVCHCIIFLSWFIIVWFYHDVWFWHVFAEFWHRLHWLKTPGLMPSTPPPPAVSITQLSWVVVVLRSPIHANEPSECNGMLYRTSNRVLNNGIKVIILICMDGTSQYHHHPELTLVTLFTRPGSRVRITCIVKMALCFKCRGTLKRTSL